MEIDLEMLISTSQAWLDETLGKLGWDLDTLQSVESQKKAEDVERRERRQRERERGRGDCEFLYGACPTVVPMHLDRAHRAHVVGGNRCEEIGCKDGINIENQNASLTSSGEASTSQRLAAYNSCMDMASRAQAEEISRRRPLTADELLTDLQAEAERNAQANRDKAKSLLELRAEERDLKRRRQTYRAKNVHITRKSYTQVMQEVIASQMEQLESSRESEEVAPPRELSPSLSTPQKHRDSSNDSESDRDTKHRHRHKHKQKHKHKKHKR